jgi:hypothetical protein
VTRTRLYTEPEVLALLRAAHERGHRTGWGDGAMGHALHVPAAMLDGDTVPAYLLRVAGVDPRRVAELTPVPPMPAAPTFGAGLERLLLAPFTTRWGGGWG